MARRNVELNEKQRARFDKCWEVYPRKVEKGEAEIAWVQLDPDETLTDQIFHSILAQNKDRGSKRLSKEDKKFIKHFSSWIRARGWVYESERDGDYVTNQKQERLCECGKKMVWTNGERSLCTECYDKAFHPDFKAKLYQLLCERGLGKLKTETREEWLIRMKAHGRRVVSKHYGKSFKTIPS